MNIAILLGVSDYLSKENNLPGCKKDIALMNNLLASIQKYDEVLVIDEDTSSSVVKKQLSDFISKYSTEEIEELFFYYTGHGEFDTNEFYYILSDFERKRKKQTSLENSEIDNMFRSLSPKLVIKVVDACHSGVAYVKGDNSLDKYLKENRFEKCYFMFSSQFNQSSYQESVSDFTKSFIDCIVNYQGTEIRYKDISDYIADDFTGNSLQTPFFVLQGSLTEKFGIITSDIKKILQEQSLSPTLALKSTDGEKSMLTLEEFIVSEANEFYNEEQVLEILFSIQNNIESYNFISDLPKLFDFKINFHKNTEDNRYSEPLAPKLHLIGKWLQDNPNTYFANPIFRTETYEEEELVYSPGKNLLASLRIPEKKLVEKTRKVVTSFESSVDFPYKLIKITSEPKYQNLSWGTCFIIYVCSKVNIRFFYAYTTYKELNWKSRSMNKDFAWKTLEVKLKDNDKISETVGNILKDFGDFLLNPIIERYKENVTTNDQTENADAS